MTVTVTRRRSVDRQRQLHLDGDNTNQDPTFNQDLPDRPTPRASLISLDAGATDADGDPLTYAATGLPAGLSIDTSSGLISGTLSSSSAGVHNVTVTVTRRQQRG